MASVLNVRCYVRNADSLLQPRTTQLFSTARLVIKEGKVAGKGQWPKCQELGQCCHAT